MNIKQLEEFLPYAFKANITVQLHGFHGTGKSESINQIGQKLGFDSVVTRLISQMDVGDFLGLPDLSSGRTVFRTPDWLPTDPDAKVLIFLDEFNRARPDVRQSMFQFVLTGEFGGYKLPPKCKIITAVNPDTDDYQTVTFEDAASNDRFCHIKYNPTQEEFLTFAKSKGSAIDQNFITFLQMNEDKIDTPKLQDYKLPVSTSRRSNYKAAELIATGLPETLLQEGVGGLIGIENVTAFVAWKLENDVRPFTYDQLMNNFKEIKKQAKKYAHSSSGRHDVLSQSLDNVFSYLETNEVTDITEEQYQNFFQFQEILPKDLLNGFAKKVCIDGKGASMSVFMTKIIMDPRNNKLLGLPDDLESLIPKT